MEVDWARDNRPFDKDAILEKVSKFLDTYSEGGGIDEWAPVTGQDMNETRELLDEILRYKFRPDLDGDSSVQFKLINRNKEYDPIPYCLPYTHKLETNEDRFNVINRCSMIIKKLSETIDYLSWKHD